MNIKRGGRLPRTWWTYKSGPGTVGQRGNIRNLRRWLMEKRHNPHRWSSLADERKTSSTGNLVWLALIELFSNASFGRYGKDVTNTGDLSWVVGPKKNRFRSLGY